MSSYRLHYRCGAGVILLGSLVLRIVLATTGGQWWWYDENRFRVSLDCVHQIAAGRLSVGLHDLFASFDHIGFRLLGLIPAVGVDAGLPIWTAAAFFGVFSVGTLWLIWRVALMATKDETTAFWALAVAASTASLFYYDRFLFPYDPALFFGFASLLVVGNGERRSRVWLAGLMAGAGFLIYNGYWLFCGVTLCVALMSGPRGGQRLVERAAIGALGLVTPILACVVAGYVAGANPFRSMLMFSETITQGTYREGWSFPFDYFWHAEGLPSVLWLAALVWIVRRGIPHRRVLVRWGAAAITIYLGLAVGSAVLHRFVEYGRIVRCLVPYLSLISGAAVASVLGAAARGGPFDRFDKLTAGMLRPGVTAPTLDRASISGAAPTGVSARRGSVVVLALGSTTLAVIAAVHIVPALAQCFPDSFFARGRTIAWSARPDQRILIRNAHGIRVPEQADPPLPGRVLYARPHPMAYSPYLFEGYAPGLRAAFRRTDTTMQVILASPTELPPTFPQIPRPPGPLRMALRLPTVSTHERQPIIVTGCGREADIFSVIRRSVNQFQFAAYHWANGDSMSPVLTLDESKPHVIDVSMGSLLPPNSDGASARLKTWLYVAVDGKVVFNQPQAFYATRPIDIDIGRCLIGGGKATLERYPAEISSVTPIAARVIVDQIAITPKADSSFGSHR